MQVEDLVKAMEEIAPVRYAEAWDNVGLLIGGAEQKLGSVLFAIDLTLAVVEEAKRLGCGTVVAYHPPIFEGLKKVSTGSVVHEAIRAGLAVYSPHTALDVAEGGTNDVLANALGLVDVKPLRLSEVAKGLMKLVVFVPRDEVEKITSAMYEAGAGKLGNYSHCGFEIEGKGTFLPGKGANPAIGKKGKLEAVREIRVETILTQDKVESVINAMRIAHPYEEPAFDLMQLAAIPEGKGIGRIGRLEAAMSVDVLKKRLGVKRLLISGNGMMKKESMVAVCAGAGGELLEDAIKQKASLYVTGELRHHDALRAAEAGMMCICMLHSNSERGALAPLAQRLKKALPGLKTHLSHADRDPFEIV